MCKSILLAGMGFLLALTPTSAEGNNRLPNTSPDGPFKKTIAAEIQGKLRKVVTTIYNGPRVMNGEPRYPMPNLLDFITLTRWEITVHGKTYELDLGAKDLQSLAQKLNDQTVLLEGRLEIRWREKRPPTWPDGIRPLIAYPRVPVSVVVVSRLQAAPAEFVKETVSVVLSGKLDMKARLGYPARDSKVVITSGGKTYVLEFGTHSALRLAAQLYDGTTVAIKGNFTGFYSVPVMCIPTQTQLPIIRVDSLEPDRSELFLSTIAVQIKGKLDQATVWTGDRAYQDEPEFRIIVNGKTYGLEFADKEALQKLAGDLNGKTINLTGTLELRRTFAGTVWQMVVVKNLQADPGDFVRLTETIQFCCPLVPIKPA